MNERIELRGILGLIRVPTLVLHGEDDPLLPVVPEPARGSRDDGLLQAAGAAMVEREPDRDLLDLDAGARRHASNPEGDAAAGTNEERPGCAAKRQTIHQGSQPGHLGHTAAE